MAVHSGPSEKKGSTRAPLKFLKARRLRLVLTRLNLGLHLFTGLRKGFTLWYSLPGYITEPVLASKEATSATFPCYLPLLSHVQTASFTDGVPEPWAAQMSEQNWKCSEVRVPIHKPEHPIRAEAADHELASVRTISQCFQGSASQSRAS